MVSLKRLLVSLLLLLCTLVSQVHIIKHWQYNLAGADNASPVASVMTAVVLNSLDGRQDDVACGVRRRIDVPCCDDGFSSHHIPSGACGCLLSQYNVQPVGECIIVLRAQQTVLPSVAESRSQCYPRAVHPPPRSSC